MSAPDLNDRVREGKSVDVTGVLLAAEARHANGVHSEPWEGGPPPGFDEEARAGAGDRSAPGRAAPGFNLWEPAAIWAALPEPDYLVDGLFVRGSLGLIVAYGSSLKTWMAIALVLAGATGSEWLGRACQKVETLIIDFESGDYELRRRAHLVARGHKYTVPVDGFTFVSMPGLALDDAAFGAALEPLTQRFGLIIIDSLAAGSRSGLDENDARFAAPLNRLKALAVRSGCVIIVIHHARKSAGDKKQAVDHREMVRGTSAIFNAVDVVLALVRGEGELFHVHHAKARGGKAVRPFTVRVDDIAPDAVRVSAGDLAEDERPGPEQKKTERKRQAEAKHADELARAADKAARKEEDRRRREDERGAKEAADAKAKEAARAAAREDAWCAREVACVRILWAHPDGIGMRDLRAALLAALGSLSNGDEAATVARLGEGARIEPAPKNGKTVFLVPGRMPQAIARRLSALGQQGAT